MERTYNPTNDTVVTVAIIPFEYCEDGRNRWQYTMIVNGEVIFNGHDFSAPRYWDEEKVFIDLLGFLTLKPGDTDSEYFDAYTQKQLDWANSYACEILSIETLDSEQV